MKNKLLIFGFLFLSCAVNAQLRNYVMFINHADRPFNESSLLLLQEVKQESLLNELLRIGATKYLVKHLRLPGGADDLIACCETDSIQFHGLERSTELERKINKHKFDSLYEMHSRGVKSFKPGKDLFYKNKKKALLVEENTYYIYIFLVDMDYCDCVYLYQEKSIRLPLGSEAYGSCLNSIKTMEKPVKKLFFDNKEQITSHKIIKEVIENVTHAWEMQKK